MKKKEIRREDLLGKRNCEYVFLNNVMKSEAK